MSIMFACIYLVFSVCGMILFKMHSSDLSIMYRGSSLYIVFNLFAVAGMILYIISFCMWLFLIKNYNISFIQPISTGLITILTFVAGVVVFHEVVTVIKIVGIFCIIIGVFLMGFGNK